jgi:hypothetical protein
MSNDHDRPSTSSIRRVPARQRNVGFGLGCLTLAILAALTASWVPLAILVVVGVMFIGRGIATQ